MPSQIHFLSGAEPFVRRLARCTGLPSLRVAQRRFPDRESLVRVATPPARRVILVAQMHDPDPKLMPVLLAADALRRSGAARITLLVPYLPYMRQDAVFEAGEPIAQRVFGETLGRHFDEIVTLEPHLHRISDLAQILPCRSRVLSAAPVVADWCRSRRGRVLLVGPDSESGPWVRSLARRASLPCVIADKQRLGDRRVRIDLPDLPETRRAILVDDIASSGATLAAAARALRRRGVTKVDAVVVHAIFAPGALRRIRAAGVERVASCDTVPHVTNAIYTAASFAQAIADELRPSHH